MATPSNKKFFRIFHEWFAGYSSDKPPKELIVKDDEGVSLLAVRIPDHALIDQEQQERQRQNDAEQKTVRNYTRTRTKILEYLTEHPDESFGRKQLATLATGKYNPTYRTALAQLISEKLVEKQGDKTVRLAKTRAKSA